MERMCVFRHHCHVSVRESSVSWSSRMFKSFGIQDHTQRAGREMLYDHNRNFRPSLVYPMRMDWMIWNTAEPHTTKMKRPRSQGPTGYLSSVGLVVLGTFPLIVMFLAAFSLAILIRCLGAMVADEGVVL